MKNRSGFTLIELLVVISIIGLLSSVILVSLTAARGKSQDASRIETIIQVRNALELYRSQNGQYPSTSYTVDPISGATTGGQVNATANTIGQGCNTALLQNAIFNYVIPAGNFNNNNVIPNLVPTFISNIPNDPSGAEDCYLYASNGTDYKLDEITVLTNTTIAPGSVFYDSTLGSTYPASSISIYTAGAAGWKLTQGQLTGATL